MAHPFANRLADINAADPSGSSIDIDSQLNYLQVRLGTPKFHTNGTAYWDDHWTLTLNSVESTLRGGLLTNASCTGLDSVATRIFHTTTAALPRPELDSKHTQDLSLLISRNEVSECALRSTLVNMMTADSATRLSESENFELPDTFDGTNPALPSWIVDVVQKIFNDPRQYTSEISRVRYVLSRLTGEAKESVAFAYDRNGAMKIDNAGACDAFPTTQSVFDHIRIVFGDIDEAFTAE
ncbi:hypothetical protein BJ878DRAFT_579176 [Calycina marina]|uniref:Uncharacterized protein n=1 Tax=Calycina marina TaxID=1763456 RepID=A0A9P7YWA2_9HELO|nr:hypothetical protein BJ878DRAFT_579176 [Calycina marina]